MKMQKFVMSVKKFEDKVAADKKYHKVRDHCHYRGEYRSAARSGVLRPEVMGGVDLFTNSGSYIM